MSGERSGAKSFEREFVNQGYRRELDAAFSSVLGRLRDEVGEELIRTAVDCASDPASFERALDHTVDYVYAVADPTVLPREAVGPLVDWVVRSLAGQPPPPLPEVRLGRLPSVKGQALYLVLNPADVDTVREAIAPGQIWVNATELKHDAWQIVGSAVVPAAIAQRPSVSPPAHASGTQPVRGVASGWATKRPPPVPCSCTSTTRRSGCVSWTRSREPWREA